jgi:hypothetical protein
MFVHNNSKHGRRARRLDPSEGRTGIWPGPCLHPLFIDKVSSPDWSRTYYLEITFHLPTSASPVLDCRCPPPHSVYAVPGIELGTSCMLSKHSTTWAPSRPMGISKCCCCTHWLHSTPLSSRPAYSSQSLLFQSLFFFQREWYFRRSRAYDILVKQEQYSARRAWISVRCAFKQIVGKTKQCVEWSWH